MMYGNKYPKGETPVMTPGKGINLKGGRPLPGDSLSKKGGKRK